MNAISLRPLTSWRLATALAATIFATTNLAQAGIWTGAGADDEYSTAANWDDNLVPVSGSTQDINGAFTVERSVDSTAGRTFVRGGGVLNVTGGVHSDNRSGASIYNFVGDGSVGTVNQSGGSYDIGHGLRIGGGNANSDGAYNLTGGSLNISRGANSNIDSSNPGGRPSLHVGGPTVGSSGLFEISGGSLLTRFGSHVGTTGVFSVVGSGASSIGIGNNSNGEGVWLQRAGGTLKASVDAGGLTPIFVDDNGDDGAGIFAEFELGSLLDLSFNGVAPFDGTWTVLELENADIEVSGTGTVTGYTLGLALSGSTASGWSFNVDNSGANGLLTATYTAIPEPGTLVLWGFGSLIALSRRR